MQETYYIDNLYPFQDEILKIIEDLNNDVPDHYGEIKKFPLFHRIDSWRNILSNKLCALSRLEVKDIVDIVFIAKNYSFDWETIVGEAGSKDLWIDPIEICRIIDQFPIERLAAIKWTQAPNIKEFTEQLKTVHLDIFNGRENSLGRR